MKFEHEATNEIIKWFTEITKIPRCSKHEDKIRAWLLNWAQQHHFQTRTDKVGNIVIRVPASPNYEAAPVVVLQGHMDMVCEKTPESTHDFSRDPIQLVFDGDWLKADGTTLGADNGIAIAMAMTAALDQKIQHPPLELLFTVDEETGLTGANALEPGFIEGKILINLDSEDEGVFTVGCAGGVNTSIDLPLAFEKVPANYQPFKLQAGGMKGGHSGVNIKEERANAIKVLARVLDDLQARIGLRLADFSGGRAHNAIPRDCEAIIFIQPNEENECKKSIAEMELILKNEFKNTDPDLKLTIEPATSAKYSQVLTPKDARRLLDLILALPHGVAAMSTDIPGLVETSNNVANIKIENQTAKLLSSQRSSVVSRLKAHTNRIEAIARLAGGTAQSGDGYPPWPPKMDSPLLEKSKQLYQRLFHKEPVVEVIHAGLECGIIGDRNPGMDMISIGPDLKNPHSPDEKIKISAIGKVWDFLVALLKELKTAQAMA